MMTAKYAIGEFIGFLAPYRLRGLIVLLCFLFTTVSSLAPPYITKVIIDHIFPARDLRMLLLAIGVLFGISMINMILSIISNYLYAWFSNCIVRDIRLEFFRHLMNSPKTFRDRQHTGDLVYRLNNDVAVIQSTLTSSALHFVYNSLTLIGLTIMLCWLNLSLFLLSIVVIPFFFLNLVYFQPKIRRIVESIQHQGSSILSHVIERLNNVILVQLNNRNESELTRFRRIIDRLIASVMRNVTYSVSMGTISSGLVSITPMFILGWGGYQVMQDAMTLGALVAFMQYTSRLFGPVQGLHDLYIGLVQGLVSMRRVLEFMHTSANANLHDGSKPFVYNRLIEFQDVHFNFNHQSVLAGVNLKLLKGRTYALVGLSGSGKSTLANLLCGLYCADRGEILIDGIPIQEINSRNLRKHVGLVTQQIHLFHDSIAENIRYGNTDCDPSQIERITRLVGLESMDLDAMIGEHGAQLSGGEKQRICLARTLLRPVELLILDEATAALDAESESLIFQQVRHSFSDTTLLIISHRFSLVRRVDEVICLADGGIAEQGPPSRLLARPGLISQYFKSTKTSTNAPLEKNE